MLCSMTTLVKVKERNKEKKTLVKKMLNVLSKGKNPNLTAIQRFLCEKASKVRRLGFKVGDLALCKVVDITNLLNV